MSSQVAVQIPKEYELLVQLTAERCALGIVRKFARGQLFIARMEYFKEIGRLNKQLESYRKEKNVYEDEKTKEIEAQISEVYKRMSNDNRIKVWAERVSTVHKKVKEYGIDGEENGKIPEALRKIGIEPVVEAVKMAKALDIELKPSNKPKESKKAKKSKK